MIKNFIIFAVITVLLMFLCWCGTQYDLWINSSWLPDAIANFKWYNYLSTKHGYTALYLSHPTLWLILNFIFSSFVGLIGLLKSSIGKK